MTWRAAGPLKAVSVVTDTARGYHAPSLDAASAVRFFPKNPSSGYSTVLFSATRSSGLRIGYPRRPQLSYQGHKPRGEALRWGVDWWLLRGRAGSSNCSSLLLFRWPLCIERRKGDGGFPWDEAA